MEFYSESNRPKTIPHPETSRYQAQYQERIDKNGKTYLKKIDKIDVYDKIQQASDGVTLDELVKKYKIKINNIDLTKLESTVMDLTEVPDNIPDMLNKVKDAEHIWMQQPSEIKNFFNNNFKEFLAGAENGTILSLIKQNKKVDVKAEQTQQEQVQPTVQVQEIKQEQEQVQPTVQPQGGINYNA